MGTHRGYDISLSLSLSHLFLSPPQMSTKEKLITHVMKEEPVGCRNKVTVVGVGMVGMASAVSVLLKVRMRGGVGGKGKEGWVKGQRREVDRGRGGWMDEGRVEESGFGTF